MLPLAPPTTRELRGIDDREARIVADCPLSDVTDVSIVARSRLVADAADVEMEIFRGRAIV